MGVWVRVVRALCACVCLGARRCVRRVWYVAACAWVRVGAWGGGVWSTAAACWLDGRMPRRVAAHQC